MLGDLGQPLLWDEAAISNDPVVHAVGPLVQNSRRSFVVLSSLVGVLTLTSVLLRAMQGAPLTADAATGLTSMRADMEAYYQNFRTYAAANGGTPPCINGAKYGKFNISCAAPTANGYVLQATSTDNLLKEFVFTVDQKDTRQTLAAPAGWIGGGGACLTRWVMVKGEAC